MKHHKEHLATPYEAEGSVVLRLPSLPLHVLREWLDGRMAVEELLQRDEIHESLYYASPLMIDELEKNIKRAHIDPDVWNKKDGKKLINSVTKYLSRMATRCTPFGAFASCGVGTLVVQTSLPIEIRRQLHFNYDMGALERIVSSIATKMDRNYPQMSLIANSTIYKAGKNLRYLRWDEVKNVDTAEVKSTPLLKNVLKLCKGPKEFGEVVDSLLSTYENISKDEAAGYISDLLKSQVLVSDLTPSIIGDGYLQSLQALASANTDESTVIERLIANESQLNNEAAPAERLRIVGEIESLTAPYGVKRQEVVQVDSYFVGSNMGVSEAVVAELRRGLDFLCRAVPRYGNGNLTDFSRQFQDKYEGATVPLMEALDPDYGVGYAGNRMVYPLPLVGGLKVGNQSKRGNESYVMTPLQRLLYDKVLTGSGDTIELTDEDVARLGSPVYDDLPDTLAAMMNIVATDDGRELLVNLHFNGVSSANLLGRFMNGSEEIGQLCRKIAQREQARKSDTTLAEISHISSPRIGNILRRERIRDVEIEVLTPSRSGARRIPVSQLWVRVNSGKIELLTGKGEKIIPRLTTAHNYHLRTHVVYQFLCDLQSQGLRPGLSFSWGSVASLLPHLPRVKYGAIIVSPERWKLNVTDFRDEKKLDVSKFKDVCHRAGVKRYVWYPQGDNTLYVDIDNERSVSGLFSAIKGAESIMIEEVIESELPFNECIIPLFKN